MSSTNPVTPSPLISPNQQPRRKITLRIRKGNRQEVVQNNNVVNKTHEIKRHKEKEIHKEHKRIVKETNITIDLTKRIQKVTEKCTKEFITFKSLACLFAASLISKALFPMTKQMLVSVFFQGGIITHFAVISIIYVSYLFICHTLSSFNIKIL